MPMQRLQITGQTAIVTGAGRGIGRSIATALAQGGARVVCSARTRAEIDATVAQIESAGGEALAVTADVMREEDLQALVDRTVDAYGGVDIVINNAGGNDFKAFREISSDEFRHHFEWNTTSAFMLSRIAVDPMLAGGGGCILNISSAAARIGIRGMLAYGVAKAGLDHLTRNMAEELAPRIRVNALALGSIMTPALQNTFDMDPSFREKLIEKTPLKSVGDADDVGMAALFMCSPAAAYITGAILNIDGGLQDTNLPFRLPDL